MRLLIDSDAFCKIGSFGLLAEVGAVLGVGTHECARLPALPYMLRRGRLARHLGSQRCAALIPLAEAMPTAPSGDQRWRSAIATATQIDPGEAQLFAAAATSGHLVLTGDKKAMRMINGVDGLTEALLGRIVCVEAVLIRLCAQMGVESVRACIVPAMELDAALSACFNSVDPVAGLHRYVNALKKDLPVGLLWE